MKFIAYLIFNVNIFMQKQSYNENITTPCTRVSAVFLIVKQQLFSYSYRIRIALIKNINLFSKFNALHFGLYILYNPIENLLIN